VLDSNGDTTPKQAWLLCDSPGSLDNIQCRVRRALKTARVNAGEVSTLKALLIVAEGKRKTAGLFLDSGKENNNNNKRSTITSSSSSSSIFIGPLQPRRIVTKNTRRTTHQVDVALSNEFALKVEYSMALKSATMEYAALLEKEVGDRSNGGAEGIAKRINLTIAEGAKHLTARIIRSSVQKGHICL
jgi:hypothetical protein